MPKKVAKKVSKKAAKKVARKVAAKPRAASQKNAVAAPATSTTAPVTKQPQSKQDAAKSAGMFLKTDDSWAAAYFDPNDLHFLDREVFG
jgi:hypothetical protein